MWLKSFADNSLVPMIGNLQYNVINFTLKVY